MNNLKLIIVFLAIFLIFLLILLATLIYKNLDMKNDIFILHSNNVELKKQNYELHLTQESLHHKLNQNDDEISDLRLSLALDSVENNLESSGDGKKIGMDNKLNNKFIKSIPNGFPVVNNGITDGYGMRTHPISKKEQFHHGVDLRAKLGTPIYATADGIVQYSANSSTGYGYLVIITHNFGFETRYAHLKDYSVVKVGEWVKRGDLIGYSGNTGYSTGPHLHYEVRFLGRTLDPENFMKFNNIFYDERKVPWQALIDAMGKF